MHMLKGTLMIEMLIDIPKIAARDAASAGA